MWVSNSSDDLSSSASLPSSAAVACRLSLWQTSNAWPTVRTMRIAWLCKNMDRNRLNITDYKTMDRNQLNIRHSDRHVKYCWLCKIISSNRLNITDCKNMDSNRLNITQCKNMDSNRLNLTDCKNMDRKRLDLTKLQINGQ